MRAGLLFLLIIISSNVYAHSEELQVIEVSHGKDSSSLIDFIPSVSQLKEKELLKRREISLGETIRHEPGIHSTSFGPNASRPIIRGLEGDRVRILQNGLGTLDASSQSVDHAIAVDTLTIDKIEVVRGPMSLLYGSSAVGGVVNIINSRIHREYNAGLINQVDVRGETATNGVAGAARMDYGKNQWMYHLDAAYQNHGDLEIPGKAKSQRLREASPSGDEVEDRLQNSENQQTSLAAGVSRILEKGYMGVSYYRFDNEYGTVADPEVDIRMQQNRVELAGEYRMGEGSLKKISFRSAQSFYKHEELEGETVGTTFRNGGNEARLEFHTSAGEWNGVSGIQTQFSTFRALGEEAFLPTSKTKMASLFTLQEYELNKKSTLQAGGRIENTNIEREESARFGSEKEKSFTGLNGSLGYLRKFDLNHSASLSLSYTERAPNFQELFADGEHVATSTFEIGDTSLDKEKGYAFEGSIKKDRPDSKLIVSGFIQKFQDYITLSPTGTSNSDPQIPDFAYEQDRAYLYGGEVDSKEELAHSFAGGSLWINTRADIVIGWNESTDDFLPRMPAPRLMLGLEYVRDLWSADLEWERYSEQHRTAPNEERTEAFSLVNAGVIYDIPKETQNYRIYLRAKNLFNQEARLHTSTLKDVAPLSGRNFVAGFQAIF